MWFNCCIFHSLCYIRYAPLMPTKQIMKFDVDGVQLSPDYVCNKQFCTIHLENLSKKTSGSYRCEISGDWPEFKLSHEEANLTVAGEWSLKSIKWKINYAWYKWKIPANWKIILMHFWLSTVLFHFFIFLNFFISNKQHKIHLR